MPRKRPAAAARLTEIVRLKSDVECVAIDGCSEVDTAAILAESSIFLALGHQESFGLPPVEAMASGCIVCGFSGEGMTDYATPDNGFWAQEDDLAGCVRSIQAAVEVFARPNEVAKRVAAGRETAERHSLSVFNEKINNYFSQML